MKVSVSVLACSWLATLTFMAGFLVFIARPWSGWEATSTSPLPGQAPVAQGLSGLAGEAGGAAWANRGGVEDSDEDRQGTRKPGNKRRKKKKKKKQKKGEKKELKEARLVRRRKRMLAEQEEYRQWRKDVLAGKISEEEDTFQAVLDELLNELF